MTALLNIVVATYIYSLVPEFLLRFIAWVLVHTFYRIRLVHAERIPEEGAAVLVCNHVSFVDAIVIMAESPRPIRFVMDHQIFKSPFAGWVFRHAKAIPIAPAHQDPALLSRAYERCAQALAEGDLVCIFPEGKLTKNGRYESVSPWRDGNHSPFARACHSDGAAWAVGQRVLAGWRYALATADPEGCDEPPDARGGRADRSGAGDARGAATGRHRTARSA